MRVASKKEGNGTLSNLEKSRYPISSGQLLQQIFCLLYGFTSEHKSFL